MFTGPADLTVKRRPSPLPESQKFTRSHNGASQACSPRVLTKVHRQGVEPTPTFSSLPTPSPPSHNRYPSLSRLTHLHQPARYPVPIDGSSANAPTSADPPEGSAALAFAKPALLCPAPEMSRSWSWGARLSQARVMEYDARCPVWLTMVCNRHEAGAVGGHFFVRCVWVFIFPGVVGVGARTAGPLLRE